MVKIAQITHHGASWLAPETPLGDVAAQAPTSLAGAALKAVPARHR